MQQGARRIATREPASSVKIVENEPKDAHSAIAELKLSCQGLPLWHRGRAASLSSGCRFPSNGGSSISSLLTGSMLLNR
jgi:hypothetical protein